MLAAPSRVVLACAALGGLASQAHAFQSQMDAHGQGQSRASAWFFPNRPPATPNFNFENPNSPSLNVGPFAGSNPRTHAIVQGTGDLNWRLHAETESAGGDTIDWHSMLPHVTPVSTDSSGFMDIEGDINFAPGSATFRVHWGATDAGTAMHIGWFEEGQELFETPIMVGPFERFDTFTITSTGSIDAVMLETSMASTSIPAPGALALLGLGLAVGLRRRRR